MSRSDFSSARPELLENLEEAYFAVLMDRFSQEEGERLLEENRRLCEDESFVYPEELDKKCLRIIKRAFAKQKRAKSLRGLRKVGNVAAVFIAVVALCAALLFTTVEAFRNDVLNFVLAAFDYDAGTVVKAVAPQEVPFKPLPPTWVPEEYLLVEELNNGESYSAAYSNGDSNEIHFTQSKITSTPVIDTEDAEETQDATINGCEAIIAVKDGQIILLWLDNENASIFRITSENLDRNTLIKIAESCYK